VLSTDQAEDCMDIQSQRLALIGHSHVALFFVRPDGEPQTGSARGAQAGDGSTLDMREATWLVNPGSVGQPRDGDPRAAWLELDTEECSGRYHRVTYDIEAAAEAIIGSGLPRHLGERLYAGQ
jgi:diadenosine tetraphosphatase ApaH/serine/threonine PP2A family protein phosphatase